MFATRLATIFVALGVGFSAAQAGAQGAPVAGRDYQLVTPPQPMDGDAQVEVLEFFAYGCIHCYTLEAKLDSWAKQLPKDTKVRRVPTPFAIKGVDSVPLYYTLEIMGLLDKLHLKVFEAIHKENLQLGNPEVRSQWLKRQGVDVAKYEEIEKSFAVVSKVGRARKQAMDYRIESTPTLVVNGKYAVPNTSPERVFQVVDALASTLRAQAPVKPASGKN